MILELTSGEKASVEIIRRKEAIEILSKPTYRRTWFGQKFRAPSRNHRGPGAAVDLVNYGLVINDKCRAVMRIGNAALPNLRRSTNPLRIRGIIVSSPDRSTLPDH